MASSAVAGRPLVIGTARRALGQTEAVKSIVEVFVSLWVVGDLEPAEVSERLGLPPSGTQLAGELVGNGRSGRRYERSGWFLSSRGAVDSDTFEPHMRWLLDQLEPSLATLLDLLTRVGVQEYVDCFWASPGMSGGPWISPESMTVLGSLGVPLIISFYSTAEDEQ